jgi:hypothetical protein
MSYYTIGASAEDIVAIAKRTEAKIRNLASKAKKGATGLKRRAESHIQAKAKEGAISATPAIRAEVRSEVTPYVAAAAGLGILAIIIAARK